ncbi:unnamed protein product [Linum tenue]|uniref:Uncharacterized protein n=1 Tax=Linum tenue TaxID=586396 RepID=A0AAV0PVT8_9ROSI|nr:unnamed protein product [Linum tenue]
MSSSRSSPFLRRLCW